MIKVVATKTCNTYSKERLDSKYQSSIYSQNCAPLCGYHRFGGKNEQVAAKHSGGMPMFQLVPYLLCRKTVRYNSWLELEFRAAIQEL